MNLRAISSAYLGVFVLATTLISSNTPLTKTVRPHPGANQFSVARQQLGHAPTDLPDPRMHPQMEALSQLPLSFEANKGQMPSEVAFFSRGSGYSVFLGQSGEAVLVMQGFTQRSKAASSISPTKLPVEPNGLTATSVVRMQLFGADPKSPALGLDELPGHSNYLIGRDPKKWQTHVPTYARVQYRDIYPGIDLLYYGNQSRMEYDLVVAPGANPGAIRLGFAAAGGAPLRINDQGELLVSVQGRDIRLHKPKVYQPGESGGDKGIAKHFVDGRYKLEADGAVGFELPEYDPTKVLVIDPMLSFSTYLGGSGDDFGQAITLDSSGNIYIGGSLQSNNFPTTTGAFQTTFGGGGFDAFVTKLNPSGTAIIYSTYVGGSGDDVNQSIAVDSSGEAFIGGTTSSSNFPTTVGAYQTSLQGSTDGFVTKLNAGGTGLVYSTYLGNGAFIGEGSALAIDATGAAYLSSSTDSSSFPVTPGAFQTSFHGGFSDGFVSKLDPTGSTLLYSTYLGGSDLDLCGAIAVDASGNAYVVCGTDSTDFPTTPGAFQTSRPNPNTITVTKLNPTGTAQIYGTYLGGNGGEAVFAGGIHFDTGGNAYVSGYTFSTSFPVTAGAFQTSFGGGSLDGFIAKLNSTGSGLVYATYLGGNGEDIAFSNAVDASGNIYVAGDTQSSNFPTLNAIQNSSAGSTDAFVTELNPTGSALIFSTYLGGSGSDSGFGITLDSAGAIYVTGRTASSDFPTVNPIQAANAGGFDAFIAKITFGIGPPTSKDQCKNGGWQTFTIPRKFKNQGDCVSYVNTGK